MIRRKQTEAKVSVLIPKYILVQSPASRLCHSRAAGRRTLPHKHSPARAHWTMRETGLTPPPDTSQDMTVIRLKLTTIRAFW